MFTYERLEVPRVINATCHWTQFGGSVMWPEVVEAMADARRSCVDMRLLLDRASEVISHYTHAEASHVVSGCAAGLVAGAAAMMTGGERWKMQALPHTSGPDGKPLFKNEFIARRMGRVQDPAAHDGEYASWGYAHAVRAAGGVFREVGATASGHGVAPDLTREELEAAFGPHTAGVYWVSDGLERGLGLREVIQIAHAHGVPVLVDASNTLPPAENLHAFIDMDADLVAFSGGKGLRGPQGSGILTGRADLVRAARMQSAPAGGMGRPLKVSKEEIVGLVTALEIWASQDHEAAMRDALRRTDHVVQSLAGIEGVRAERRFPDHLGRPYPTAFLHLNPAAGRTAAQVIGELLSGQPSVAVMGFDDPQVVRADVRILPDDEVEQVIARLRDVLGARGTIGHSA
jgi:D-glucosaminate-6-phosphate ammonia-lyase